ncbi:MAG TPA: DUF916 domain-containing protein [Pseudonocardiaceae bacterium]|nr:DUF916 domain-containing protein [Pseudonocardiaceae bacterium]
MTRFRIAVATGFLGLAATAGLAGVASAAPVNISWAVAPSTQNGPDGRTHYTYTDVKPGTLVHDFVGITNYSTQPVTFAVYASDGVTTSAGSIGLAPAKQKPVDIGAWLHTARAEVTVPPRARVNEPITLTVPANATPGDHVGGVIASVSETPQGGKVTREDRVGVAVYLRVAGPLHPALSVESASTNGYHDTVNPFGGGSTTVSYTVHNTGNVRLSGNQEVTVTGLFGIPLATVHPTTLQQVLPGDSVRVVAHLSGVFPAGPLDVHVKVTPVEVPGSPHLTVPLAAGSYTVSIWATPWAQLGLLILLVAAAFGVRWWLRGRRRRRADLLAAAVEQGRREAQLAAVSAGEDSE